MYMQTIVLPTIIILLPIILFSFYGLSIKSKIGRKLLISGFVFFLIGLVVPWIATIVSAYGFELRLSDEWIPARGSGSANAEEILHERSKLVIRKNIFLFYGYLINLIGIPFLGLIFYLEGKEGKK